MLPTTARNSNPLKRTASKSGQTSAAKRRLPLKKVSEASSSTMSPEPSPEPSSEPSNLIPPLNFFTPQLIVEITIIDEEQFGLFAEQKAKCFTIHHNVLAHYSLSFREKLEMNPFFKKMTLHGSDNAFGILQNWLYTQKIEGPSGEIKLIEHAKLWKLAKDLIIDDLTERILDIMDITQPGDETDIGNTLHDFQQFAYNGEFVGLETLAVSKTLSAMNEKNVDRVLSTMPDEMRSSFTIALARGCVALPGWDNGVGFGGVGLRGRGHRTLRRAGKTSNTTREALDKETASNCSETREQRDFDVENSEEDSDDEMVPETELLNHDESYQETDYVNSPAREIVKFHGGDDFDIDLHEREELDFCL